jgi:hypothetical protein
VVGCVRIHTHALGHRLMLETALQLCMPELRTHPLTLSESPRRLRLFSRIYRALSNTHINSIFGTSDKFAQITADFV